MYNYKYIENGNKIIALSTFAGKAVRGIAKCNPADTFNSETGRDLATARCANKIARKRVKRAEQKLHLATIELEKAQAFYSQMKQYHANALAELHETEDAVENFMNNEY